MRLPSTSAKNFLKQFHRESWSKWFNCGRAIIIGSRTIKFHGSIQRMFIYPTTSKFLQREKPSFFTECQQDHWEENASADSWQAAGIVISECSHSCLENVPALCPRHECSLISVHIASVWPLYGKHRNVIRWRLINCLPSFSPVILLVKYCSE